MAVVLRSMVFWLMNQEIGAPGTLVSGVVPGELHERASRFPRGVRMVLLLATRLCFGRHLAEKKVIPPTRSGWCREFYFCNCLFLAGFVAVAADLGGMLGVIISLLMRSSDGSDPFRDLPQRCLSGAPRGERR